MKILVITMSTPGLATNELTQYLQDKTDHDVRGIACPAKHERRFIPGWAHWQNMAQVSTQGRRFASGGAFDLAIGADPAMVLALHALRKDGAVKRVAYWRLDYYPRKYPYPFDCIYQWLERRALALADEIWSIADPSLPQIQASLSEHLFKVKHVPYLLHEEQVQVEDNSQRRNMALWMGPDLDGSRPLCIEAAKQAGVPLEIADYSIDQYRRTSEELDRLLRQAKVCVAPYKPVKNMKASKYYCDASRIRRALAYGVPVVTTAVAPTYKTVLDRNAGYISDWNAGGIQRGIESCLLCFDERSFRARQAADAYTFERWFPEHEILNNVEFTTLRH